MDVFGGAPRFLAYPRPVIVQSGTDAALKCQIGGDPRPAVIWERNNEKIRPEGRYRLFEDGNVYNLIISGVTSDDSGQYICKAKNSIGETYAAATLKVEGEMQERELREENKPRFLIKPLSTRVGRGEDAVFSCKLWGKPRPEVVWEKDGKKLNEIFESTHFSVSYQDGGWFQLKIFKTRAPDGGVYTCKARNEFGEGLAGAVLLVDAGPGHEEEGTRNGYSNGHWKPHQGKQRGGRQVAMRQKEEPLPNLAKVKMFAVTEGKHAKFRCFVTGKPKPEIIWRKDGRLVMSGRRYLLYEDREGYFTLKVLYCKQKDNGVYVCAASNTAGQTLSAVHLSVKEPPVRFKQPLNDLEVWERDLAILECEVPEDSVPTTWYLEDRRLQPGAKYGMEEWGTKRRLTIRDIGADDDGIYLCEMADGGRSIAEVSVKGTIVRRLPRKVDVLEGENAAFCVEVEEEEMEIHWYKDGTELRETHQTIIKSFGKTHILVFVNTLPPDSGTVMFIVGRSKTSSQLRVKAARHIPPSCPVGVQINLERANAALLSWVPAHDSRRNPPSGYVLERQEVGFQEWLQCLTTDSATSVEILGDSVPCEADYRFRICSVNKYGKSGHVEFPRAAHLVPVAKIQAPLQDALVPECQDASFTIELSASVIGTWFLNGTQLQEDDRFSMRRSRTHHSLRIRGVQEADNGAEITFIAYGIRDSAALYIQAPLVKFTPLSEMDRNKFVEVGNPIVLYCELSDPAAPVHWYKNGVELHTVDNLHIQAEGTMRRIVIQSAEFTHSGVYSCDAVDDVIRFNVEVEAPAVRFSAVPEVEKNKSVEAGCPIVLHCELSDPAAQVSWYKDGIQLHPQTGIDFQSDGTTRTLIVQAADFFHSGEYSCKTKGDAIKFNVDVKAPPVRFTALSDLEKQTTADLSHSGLYSCVTVDDGVALHVDVKAPAVRFSAVPEFEKNKVIEEGCPIVLHCELSDPAAQVCWYKEKVKLCPQAGVDFQSNGNTRRLIIQSAKLHHSGSYCCKTSDDVVQFTVDIKASTAKFSAVPEVEKTKSVEAGCPIVQHCELSDPAAQVSWYKDGIDGIPQTGIDTQTDGTRGTLVVQSDEFSNSGAYSCETTADVIQINVNVKAPPVRFSAVPEVEKNKSVEEGSPIVLHCELSDPAAQVSWYKDGKELFQQAGLYIKSEGVVRTLLVQSAKLSHSGTYSCKTTDDTVHFNVEIKEALPHSGVCGCEISDDAVQCTVDIKAAPVSFSTNPDVERNASVEDGKPALPQCQFSEPTGQVCCFKDGIELQSQAGPDIQSDGSVRALTLQDAELSLSLSNDAQPFTADAEAPSGRFTALLEAQKNKSMAEECNPIVPLCEQSEPLAQVCWHKDEAKPIPQPGPEPSSGSSTRRLIFQTAKRASSKENSCEVDDDDDAISLKVDVKAPLVRFKALPELEKNKSIEAGSPIMLHCELSDPTAKACWYQDGTEFLPRTGQVIQTEGTARRLIIQSAELSHTGVFSCVTTDDAVQFNVDVKAPLASLARFSAVPEVEKNKSVEASCPIVLHCELSDPAGQVCWPKDGIELQPQTGIDIHTSRNMKTPNVSSTDLSHSGAYSCKTTDDDVQYYVDIKAPPVRFSAVPEVEKNKSVEAGCPIVLHCEHSDPAAQVSWYKDGIKLLPKAGVDIQSKDKTRTLFVESADLSHSGTYCCKTTDDVIMFNVEIKAPSPKFIELPEEERNKCVEAGCPIVLHCELSDPAAQVSWYKERIQLHPQAGIDIQSEGTVRKLIIQSAELFHAGMYSCGVAEDFVTFKVDVQVPPVRFSAVPEFERNKVIEEGCPIVLHCELSDPAAQVCWYKDGIQLQSCAGLDIQSKGTIRTLIVQSAELSHSGAYCCEAADDVIAFKVDVEALPMRFSAVPEVEKNKSVEAGCPIVLHCELSDPAAQVSWYKDGIQLHPQTGIDIQSDGTTRTLVIQSAEFSRSGIYSCKTTDDISEFYVDVKAPPVTFVEVPEENLHKSVVELDPLVLYCEVSRPNATTLWYKDGVEIPPSNNRLTIQADGTLRRLIIRSTELSDTGTYTCRAGDNTLLFKVTIREPPVRIAYPKEDVHLDRHVSEEIVLSCELSRPNGTVNWYKDGQKLQESENIKLKSEGPYRRLKIHRGTVEDSGEYVCDTADDSIFFQLNIREAPVRIVSPSQSQMELCQQTSERMVLSCEISRPNAEVRWYRDGLEVEENENLLLEVDGVYRRLIIPETTLQDSAEYVCDTADDSVTFFVNIAEPPVRFVRPRKMASAVGSCVGDPVVLQCEVSRPNAKVSWKKEGEEMEDSGYVTITEDGVSRQLTIHSSTLEDSGQYICDARDDVMDFQVNITEPPIRILMKPEQKREHRYLVSEDIVLECELSRASGTLEWYKDGEKIEENERFCFEKEGTFPSLVILNAELTDSGKYFCDVKDDNIAFDVSVREPPVTILGNSECPEHHILVAGDDLILECEVSRHNASVEWYCNGRLLRSDARANIESRGTVRKLVLSGLRPSDSGQYICDATEDKMITTVKVQEPPAMFLNKEKENMVTAYENESVTLTAKVTQVNATVQWLKDWTHITGDRFHTSSDGNNRLFIIDSLQRSDTGKYTCDATTDQMDFTLLVKEMRVKFITPLEDSVIQVDGQITLQCELNTANGDVQWLKDGQEIIPNRRLVIRAEGQERTLTIHEITREDAGVYSCESKDDRTCATIVVQMPRIVEFIAELHTTTVLEEETATFKCVVSPEDIQLVWRKDGQIIVPDKRFTVSKNGLCHMLHIHNCKVANNGQITAEAEGVVSKANLQVQEAQVLFTKKMESILSEEHGEATLEVELSLETGEVQWIRQGIVVQPGQKYTLKQCGRKRILTIHKLNLSDQGTYRCETLHDCTQAKLSVERRKITIKKELSEVETFERETASFEVELSHPEVEGVWQKDGIRLKASSQCRVSAKGRVHSLTLSNLTLEDTGTIIFFAENVRTSARLIVKEPPVIILKRMENQCLPEGTTASLECELSKQNADARWLKDGTVVKPDKSHRIYSMGRKRFLQILKCDTSDSGIYTCDAGDTSASCSLDVYERELEVLHDLEDLDIQEDQNAVFTCEVSLEDVSGEWYKNGERIRQTSTIKIRHQGTKHFLLMCNVKPEDSGEIKFVAKQTESTAYLEVEELPVTIVKALQDKTAVENSRVVLECTVSNPRSSIRWYHGSNVILPSEHFEICSEGCNRKLVIQQVALEDEGVYSVQVGDHKTSARLMVEAQSIVIVQELENVDVTPPREARFECQISAPVAQVPVWSLNGKILQSEPNICLENLGTIHRLVLRQTSEDMSGVVTFTVGQVNSSAKISVKKGQ